MQSLSLCCVFSELREEATLSPSKHAGTSVLPLSTKWMRLKDEDEEETGHMRTVCPVSSSSSSFKRIHFIDMQNQLAQLSALPLSIHEARGESAIKLKKENITWKAKCQRTYASVTAPGSSEESADLLIDEADSEEAASPTSAREGAPSTSSSPPPGQPEKQPLAASVREPKDAPARAAVATSARKASTSEPVPQASVCQPADECMDTTQGSASAAAGKRPHEQTTSSEPQLDDGGGDEPPTKAPGAAQEGTSESDKPLVAPGTKAEKKAGDDDAKAASESSAAAREVGPGATDVEMTAAGAIASKRAREASDSTGNVGTSGTGEPPKKTATGRRPTLKPRPNLPPDRGETPTPPPP
ncbi:hypothetical protein HPB52_007360 [Rhipicephalus sanguineus]|uniref:Uncharacterized protein n=1 Tax=Rhipicephalus sanguineus TaxID=34632 RepID=A0A9D4T7W3_RHISA|nr:hypothetical protein HPB52_007360 [Rhipicephalus sanguineus]